MDQPRRMLVFRVLAVVFSVSLAAAYISCNSNDPPSDDDPDVLPSTKSAPIDSRGSYQGEGSEDDPDSAEPDTPPEDGPESKPDPRFFPGSKSAPPFTPGELERLLKKEPENNSQKNIPDPLREIEEGSK